MKNPVKFVKKTMDENLQVVCLTATPDDGIDDGSERNLLNLMGYKLIRTGAKQDLEEPKIDTRARLKCATDVMDQVREFCETRAVLIYANEPLISILEKDHFLKRVTIETPDSDLRSMDVRKNGSYPIYLISEDYGIRGLDYRAPSNPFGICMIICDPFPDWRTRLQALKRIKRYKDQGNYVQNDLAKDIDQSKFVAHKAKIAKAEVEVRSILEKSQKPEAKPESQAQKEEQDKNYA